MASYPLRPTRCASSPTAHRLSVPACLSRRADSGSILVDSADITPLPMHQRARRGIGYLSQEAGVFRKLSVEENLMAIREALLSIAQS